MIRCTWLGIMRQGYNSIPLFLVQNINECSTILKYNFLVKRSIQFTVAKLTKYSSEESWKMYFLPIKRYILLNLKSNFLKISMFDATKVENFRHNRSKLRLQLNLDQRGLNLDQRGYKKQWKF